VARALCPPRRHYAGAFVSPSPVSTRFDTGDSPSLAGTNPKRAGMGAGPAGKVPAPQAHFTL
jgi:hypothetical protein